VEKLSPRPRRIALVAKVSLVRFEKTPPRLPDLDQLIKWQMRKAAPFRIEDAQVAWSESGVLEGGGREYLVVLARRDIVESYERACETAGVHPGVVDIASLNIVNAALAVQPSVPGGDWLLIHIAPGYATIAVVRSGRVMFFRNRQSEGAAETDLDELVHQTAMYHEDRLSGAAFTRVVLSGATTQGIESVERIRRQIEERLRVKVETLDVVRDGVTLRDRIVAGPELIDSIAPAVGVLLRERPVSSRTRAEQVA
jgi:Tfp pilus assembly PilM family ATPase